MTPEAERIDLLTAEDPRDVVHRAVACLAQGGIVALPAETSYVLAASALDPSAVGRLRAMGSENDDTLLGLGIREPDELIDWVPDASALGKKLARRAWPGPVTLVFSGGVDRGLSRRLPASVRSAVRSDGGIVLRLSDHDVVREILDLLPGPLVFSSVSSPDRASPHLAMLLDGGPPSLGGGNTVVSVDGDRWSILREGVVDAESLRRMTGTMLLFVCTGNTCRSPMAEAICRLLLADRLECEPGEIESRGYSVGSAGLAASQGMKAAGDAVAIVQSRGGSLRGHASRQIHPRMIAQSDWIVAMTRDHRDALLDEFPEAIDRVRLLHPAGGDIADPIGTDRETYRRTAEAIEDYLNQLLDQILPHA